MPFVRRSLAAAALVAAPALASAQPASAPPPVLLPEQSIAINPLAIPFGLFSAEYEAALPSPGFTVGIGGTYFTNDGDRDSWAEVKGLYYPNEMPFRGFSIGLSLGIHSARNIPECLFDVIGSGCSQDRKTQTAPTLGVLVSWDWLIGRQERFRVGLGIGAKRVLKDVGRADPLEQVYPDGRFVVGLVF
jgi:hypothetical protein